MKITACKPGELSKSFLFSSWGEFVNYADTAPSPVPADDRVSRRIGDFSLVRTWKEALELARGGWRSKAAELESAAAPMFDKLQGMIERPVISYDTDGHAVDIGRYVERIPECWQKFGREAIASKTPPRIVRIVYNVAAAYNVTGDAMVRKGAAVFTIIRLLEFAGVRVDLSIVAKVRNAGSKNFVDVTVPIKAADQPYEPGRLAFALCSPAVLRRLMFSVWETSEQHVLDSYGFNGGHYGFVADYDAPPSWNIYVPPTISGLNLRSAEDVNRWVLEQVAKCGVTLKTSKAVSR